VKATGVAVLDLIRPPNGYRTTAALLTTYSADLVACLAALIAMDGRASDSLQYGRIEAMRALERLRDKVLIVAQQGRIGWSGVGDRRILALFDRMVQVVPAKGSDRSFHPKVMLVRQENERGEERHVLSVSSRNLTASTDWDLGVGLVAEGGIAGTRQMPDLADFVTRVCEVAGEPKFAATLGDLTRARWLRPLGVDDMRFGFNAGGPERSFEATELAKLPRAGRAILLSPFLSSSMVSSMADHLADAEVRLVAGKADLDKVAASKQGEVLRFSTSPKFIRSFFMAAAGDDPDPVSVDNEDPEQSDERGLHAKTFAVAEGERASVIIGSANLSANAWLRVNWEAFLRLDGSREHLFDPLWSWAETHATIYRPPPAGEKILQPRDAVEELRGELSVAEVLIRDRDGEPSLIMSGAAGKAVALSGCTLEVARFTRDDQWVKWPANAAEVLVSPCQPGERTRFLAFRATQPGRAPVTWIHAAIVEPAIDDARDEHAFVSVLGVDDFLAYFQSLLDGDLAISGESDGEGDGGAGHAGTMRGSETIPFHLEDLLRRLTSEPLTLEELARTMDKYGELLRKSAVGVEDARRFEAFSSCWKAVYNGMRMA